MKFLLGIVSIVAVFAVNGQDFHKEPATSNTDNQAHGNTDNEENGNDLDIQNGPIGDHSFEESQDLSGGLKMQDFEEQDPQLKEKKGDQEITLRRSRCKARNACVVMGGFCVTNATLCSGRLVAEGCKGTNCQCCVPGTIEAMFDILKRELQSIRVDMNSTSLNMNYEMQSLKANVNTELQSLKNHIDTSNSELQSIQLNMNNSNSFMNSELQSLMNNMNNSDTELQSLKNNITSSFSNVNSKLDNQGCPEGLFHFAPSNQCFKMLNDTKRSWDAANIACRSMGLVLAQPYDPVAIRDYIVTKYGDYTYTWIGARGTGSAVQFQRSSRPIGSSNPLWYYRNTATNYCVAMLTGAHWWKTQGDKLYRSTTCTSTWWALCELATE